MKNALTILALMVISSGVSAKCFQNYSYTTIGNLTLPTKVCVTDLKTDLNAFGQSKGIIEFSINDNDSVKAVKVLTGKKFGNAYLVNFNLVSDEDNEGVCDSVASYIVTGSATISLTGELLKINKVSGETTQSSDWCHDSPTINTFEFSKL